MGVKKRGQVTVFIVIGLILLLSLSVFIFFKSTADEATVEKAAIPSDIDQASVEAYVNSCVESTTKAVVDILAEQGGIYEPTYYKLKDGKKITYWCYGEDNNQCVNALLLKEDIAEQIILGLRDQIDHCLDFLAFERQGYDVREGTLDGEVTLAPKRAEVTLDYPITLKKGPEEITLETFRTTVSSPIGELHTIAQHIINEEATQGMFDPVPFQTDHTQIRIVKQKPYPATIYSITQDDVTLNFAVQGVDTVSSPGETLLGTPTPKYGCCYVEGACFANTPSNICETKQGSYETAPCSCDQPVEIKEETTCDGDGCANCGSKNHGESWCEYDMQTGDGKDAVGSRHYVYSCIDGEKILEPCRDFREEICVQQQTVIQGKRATQAVCRANRWQDCDACTTQDCCENSAERDCAWLDDLDPLEGTQCVPHVPPGLRFWEYNGLEICSRANQEKTCSGLSCSQEWVDASAISCYSQADCGNGYNTQNKLTEEGFFNSDLKNDPDEDVYEIKSKADPITHLPIIIQPQKQSLASPVEEAADIFIEMITAMYRFANQWVGITVPNYLNPFTPSPKIEILDVSFCAPWQAPNTDADCDQCGKDGKPCSEYLCKSLGKKCVYEEKEGTPSCTPLPKEKQKKFTMEIDTDAIPGGYVIKESELNIEDVTFDGYKITPALTPYKPFSLGVKTSAETICRFDYTPQVEHLDPPVFMMGTAEFAEEHLITMRVPPRIEIPEKLKDGLNLTTAAEIVEAMTEPRDLLENYEESFPGVFSVYKTVTSDDLAEELDPYVEELLELLEEVDDSYPFYENMSITLLDKFDNGGYYLFVSCEDRYGNTQQEEVFVEIDIADITDDTQPPVILAFSPEDESEIATDQMITNVFVYTDEPADCRYDEEDKSYEEMQYSLTCKNDLYDLVGIAGGSYECRTTLTTAEDTTTYIRCADQPGEQEQYKIALQQGPPGVEGELYSASIPDTVDNPTEEYEEYIYVEENNATASTDIFVSAYLLSDTQATVFNSSTQAKLHLFVDDEMDCTMDDGTATIALSCELAPLADKHKGLYVCTSEQVTTTNETATYDIACAKKAQERNINTISTTYTIEKSDGFDILTISPGNNEETDPDTAMTVTTSASEDISCGYAEQGSIEFVRMNNVPDGAFTTTLRNLHSGYNTFTIQCIDVFGNKAEQTTSFYVK